MRQSGPDTHSYSTIIKGARSADGRAEAGHQERPSAVLTVEVNNRRQQRVAVQVRIA